LAAGFSPAFDPGTTGFHLKVSQSDNLDSQLLKSGDVTTLRRLFAGALGF